MCNCGCNTCETKGPLLTEGKVKSLLSEGLQYHIDKKIPLFETVYRIGSKKHLSLIKEARKMYSRNIINLCEEDEALIKTHLGEFALYEGVSIPLDLPMISEQMDLEDELANEEFGMDYDQLGSGEKEWVRDEINNMSMNESTSKKYEYIVTKDDWKKSKFPFDKLKNSEFKIRIAGEGKDQSYMLFWKEGGLEDWEWEAGSMTRQLRSALMAIAKRKLPINTSESINESYDYDEVAQSEFGMDYDQLGSGEKEWVRDEIDNMSMNELLNEKEGVPHYTKDGKEWKGKVHKMPDGSLMSGNPHDKNGSGPNGKSEKLYHKEDLKENRKYNQEELLRLDLIARRRFDCDYEKCTDEQKAEVLKDKIKVGVKEALQEGWKDMFKRKPKTSIKLDTEEDPGTFKQQALKTLSDALKDPKIKADDISDWLDDRIFDLYGKNHHQFGSGVEGQRITSDNFHKAQDIIQRWERAENGKDANALTSLKKELYIFLEKTIIDIDDEENPNVDVKEALQEAKKEIDEAEFKGKEVALGKPKRGGPKAYYVYVKDGDKVKKVTFGSGGLRAKIKNKEARNAFAARHNCKDKKDRTKAGYWSCRLPYFAKALGLGANMNTFW